MRIIGSSAPPYFVQCHFLIIILGLVLVRSTSYLPGDSVSRHGADTADLGRARYQAGEQDWQNGIT